MHFYLWLVMQKKVTFISALGEMTSSNFWINETLRLHNTLSDPPCPQNRHPTPRFALPLSQPFSTAYSPAV